MVDTLVDAASTGGNLDELEKELSAAVVARDSGAEKPEVKKEEQKSEDDGLPPKLRGKTPQEIAQMYQNLESAYGRMANDLGTQRKLTDRLLDLKRTTDIDSNSAPKVQIKSDELLDNPTAALDKYIAPREQEHAQRLAQLESQLQASAFVQRHPDYQAFTNSAEFQEWVQGSPIRVRAAQAAAAGDWGIAGDLLAEYKASKPAAKAADNTDDNADSGVEQARRVALETAAQGTAGAKKGGKVYSRAALMRLRVEKPEVYSDEGFQSEILRAYAEGRVK